MALFVSYAQNCEDVLLWRALRHVENGFYIDVGAADPVFDSVTQAFYERGWHGINVEPHPAAFRELERARTRDRNLNLALGEAEGETSLLVIRDDPRLSTTDAAQAERYGAAAQAAEQVQVRAATLAGLCRQHVEGPIHFLKIDVEGAEASVLRGADFARWRPWIVLVEAVEPGSLRASHEESERLLREAGYEFVYFDGLNRFYLAQERAAELRPAFAAPPNVADGFVPSQVATDMRLREIEAEHARVAGALHEQVHRLGAERDQCVADRDRIVGELRAELAAERAGRASDGGAEAQGMRDEVARLTVERDGWMQELFESNRYAAYLTQSRQHLVEHGAALEADRDYWRSRCQDAQNWGRSLDERLGQSLAGEAEEARWRERCEATQAWAESLDERLQRSLAGEAEAAQWQERWRATQAWGESLEQTARELYGQVGELTGRLGALDDRIRALDAAARAAAEAAERQAGRAADLAARLERSERDGAEARAWLDAVRGSTSWRLTRPLRGVLRRLGRGGR